MPLTFAGSGAVTGRPSLRLSPICASLPSVDRLDPESGGCSSAERSFSRAQPMVEQPECESHGVPCLHREREA